MRLLPVLEAILNDQKEIMLQLLWKIENMRSEIEVLALDDDFQDMETDEVALKMSATTPHRTRHASHLTNFVGSVQVSASMQ